MTDAEIISHHGGPSNLARLMGLEKPGSVQRVSNWIARGIPAEVKLAHPELFGITLGAIKSPELAGSDAQQQRPVGRGA